MAAEDGDLRVVVVPIFAFGARSAVTPRTIVSLARYFAHGVLRHVFSIAADAVFFASARS
jgi:hypothetical protein